MLYFDRTDVSEGIDVNKTSASKEGDVCHQCYFLNKGYDRQTKWMYFLTEDDDLLKKYSTVWDKVSAHIKKEFDSKPVYNKLFENQNKILW